MHALLALHGHAQSDWQARCRLLEMTYYVSFPETACRKLLQAPVSIKHCERHMMSASAGSCRNGGRHHSIEGVHVALQLLLGAVVLGRTLLEHVAGAHRIAVVVVQDAVRHLVVSPSPARLLRTRPFIRQPLREQLGCRWNAVAVWSSTGC